MSEPAVEILFRAVNTRAYADLPPIVYAETGIVATPPPDGRGEVLEYVTRALALPLLAGCNFVIALETNTTSALTGDQRESVLFALYDERRWTETWLAEIHREPTGAAHLGPASQLAPSLISTGLLDVIARYVREFPAVPRNPNIEAAIAVDLTTRGFQVVWSAPYDGPEGGD